MFNRYTNLQRIQLIELLMSWIKEQRELLSDNSDGLSIERRQQLIDETWEMARKVVSKRTDIYLQAIRDIESM